MNRDNTLSKTDVNNSFIYLREELIKKILDQYGENFKIQYSSTPKLFDAHVCNQRLKIDKNKKSFFDYCKLRKGDSITFNFDDKGKLIISSGKDKYGNEDSGVVYIKNKHHCKALLIHSDKFEKKEICDKGAGVYILFDSIDNPNKVYVGYSGNPAERLSSHKSKLKWWKDSLLFIFDNGEIHFDIADCAYLESEIYKRLVKKKNDKRALPPYVKPETKKNLDENIMPIIERIIDENCKEILKKSTRISRRAKV